MDEAQAKTRFVELVKQHGVLWSPITPRSAYEELHTIRAVLAPRSRAPGGWMIPEEWIEVLRPKSPLWFWAA
jgi:hypothetical protein